MVYTRHAKIILESVGCYIFYLTEVVSSYSSIFTVETPANKKNIKNNIKKIFFCNRKKLNFAGHFFFIHLIFYWIKCADLFDILNCYCTFFCKDIANIYADFKYSVEIYSFICFLNKHLYCYKVFDLLI